MDLTREQLSDFFPEARLIGGESRAMRGLVGIAPLESGGDGLFLVGSASRYNALSQGGAFALAEDVPLVPRPGDAILLFPAGTDISEIFTKLAAFFRHAAHSDAARRALEQAALFASPREAVEAAAAVLGRDLALYNALGELITASSPDAPRRIPEDALGNAAQFRSRGAPVAYLAGAPEDGGEALRFVRKHLDVVLRRYSAETPGQSFSTELLLRRLIDGSDLTDADLRFYAGLCGWQADGSFCLLLADRSRLPEEGGALVSFINRVETAADAGTYVTERDVLFLLALPDARFPEARIEAARAVFAEADAAGIVSRVFDGLRGTAGVYRRLQTLAPQLPRGHRALVTFDEAEPAYLLAMSGYRMRRDLHPLCLRLLAMEAGGKFPCCETVYEYLLHAQRPAAACAALHIHRNTLDYRLGRIADGCGIDFSDGAAMAQLLFSLYAAKRFGAF